MDYLASAASGLPHPGEKLRALVRSQHALYQCATLDLLFARCLAEATGQLRAEYGAILLLDRTTGRTNLMASYCLQCRPPEQPAFNPTLVKRCYHTGESLLWRDESTSNQRPAASAAPAANGKSLLCALLRTQQRPLGVLYLERSASSPVFGPVDLRLADALAANMSTAMDNWQCIREAQRGVFLQMVMALAQAVELRDPYTGGHAQRVTNYSVMLAEELHLGDGERQDLRLGAPLHDIGKIGIDDAILRKTAPLSPDEFQEMQSHTIKGEAILKPIPELANILPLVRSHHERWDGTGYPDGLGGEAIPLLARVVAVADTFDAMTTDRPYREGLPLDLALAEIDRGAATQFDPECVSAFLRLHVRLAECLGDLDLIKTTTPEGVRRQLCPDPKLALASSPSRIIPLVHS
jgi:HD-GYP domain-containing protein (c-di-GMP phosphodiesterase class II)